MRSYRRTKKKLIVAFHFQFANQAAWRCDECRKSGLEVKRRCGWIPETELPPPRVVWAREQVATTSCPTSYVTAESQAFLEEFYAWKLLGVSDYRDMPARLVEAIFVLESELRTERNSAQEKS
jgi:hypothetical protein